VSFALAIRGARNGQPITQEDKVRKWMIVGIGLLVLCAMGVVALLNVNSLIKRNKDYLLDQAQQALKRKVSVGDVEVILLNGIGVRFNNFTMSDDPTYSSDDFVRAKDLQINLKLWPLLWGRVQVKRAILHDPVISLVRNTNGDFNFSTIAKKEKEKDKDKDKHEAKEHTAKESSPGLLISLVDVSGGEVRYRDQKEHTDLQLQQVDLKLDNVEGDGSFSVRLAVALFTPKQNINLNTRVGPFPADGDIRQVPLDGKLQIDTMDLNKLSTALPQIKAALPKELDLSGAVKIKDLNFKGTLRDLSFNGVLDAGDGAIRFGKGFQKPFGIPLTISADAQYSNNTVSLRQSEIKLHTLELATKGDVRLGDETALNLSVGSKPTSLDGWEKIIPAIASYHLSGKTELRATLRGKFGQGAVPEIQGVMNLAGVSAKPPQFPKAVKNLTATIDFTGRKANIKETTLSLGESRIRLSAVIEKFSPLTLSYKMSTPEIWPADFQAELPNERKADVIRGLSSEGQLAMQESGATVQAKVVSTQGTLYKIGYKNLDANLSLANKVANIRSLRVNALSGTLQADGEYGFSTPVPRFSLASKVQGIDIKELYAALSPKAERDIRGRLNADMKISGSGRNWEEMKPTLRGQGEGEVLQGALLNFNVPENVLGGITGMPGLANLINPKLRSKYPATFEAKDTEFKEMKALFDVADSRVNVKNLRIAAADYSTQGNGWVDFERKLDFRSVLLFSQPLSADIAQSAREIKYMLNNQNQLEMPFAVTGRLPKVKAKPDANYLGRMVQRGFLGKGTEELQRHLSGNKESKSAEEPPPADTQKRKKSSTEDRIRKGIEGLFGR
jgi:uncharacterized protein involved in outer membrane biogenesis